MSNDLQSIFKSITPDNIKSIPVIQDAMDVFISTLEEVSSVSIDVKNAFENTNIKEELIKIYLDDLYNVLQQIQFNQKIVEYIERSNNAYGTEYFKKDLIYNIVDYINDEHFLTIKSYKEKKGTTQAIKYIYDLISTFVMTGDTHYPFTLTELEPFNFKVEGSLPTVFYENIIRPLAHPLGFTYYYEQILKLVLEDFYAELNFVFTTYELEIRCLKTTGETYTFDFLYKPDDTKRVVSYIDTILEGNTRIKRVFFKDGDDKNNNNNATYLKQVTTNLDQTTVYYMQGVHLKPGQEYVIKKDYNGNVIYDANGEPERATADYIIRSFSDQCSIYHRYEFEFRTSLEEDFQRTDFQTRYDYWSRLDIHSDPTPVIGGVNYNTIGDFYITDTKLSPMDIGCNNTFDRDYNIIPAGAKGGRYEHYFAPSLDADLKLLEGKFELVNVNTGPALQIITRYGDDVKSTVSVTRTNPLITFQKQNEGNEDYAAREHVYEDHWMNLTHCEELIEPVYSGTSSFIDYNGVNRGAVPGPLHMIGGDNPVKLIGTGGESGFGYYIGGYTQESSGVNHDVVSNPLHMIGGDNPVKLIGTGGESGFGYDIGQESSGVNPNWNNNVQNNPAIAYFKTCVDGDPVNLQYNTYDVSVFNLRASLTDALDTPLDTVTEFHSSSNEDFYGFYVTNARNEFIGDALAIGDTYIHGKAFHEGYLPGTNKKIWDYQTTSAAEPTAGFDFTLKEFLVSTKETYSYRLYTNQDKYTGVVGSEKLNSIGEFYIYDVRLDLHLGSDPVITICDVHSEDVLAEVYRGNWNTQQDFGVTLDGVNNFDAITDFRAINIFVENFAEANEVESTNIGVGEYDVFEVHEQRGYVGNAIEIGPDVYVHGYLAPITEETSDTLVCDSETSIYEYNTFEMSGSINGFDIGDNFFVTGKLNTTAVKSDIYRAYWTEPETGEDAFESFDCGVYRNGVLLSDNNYSRYVA